jgi:hypothetical protein
MAEWMIARPFLRPALERGIESAYRRGVQHSNLVDHGFMDARAKLLDLAAFLDRVERHGQELDFRVQALIDAVPTLLAGPERVRGILLALSDPTTEPIAEAGMQGALGAWNKPAPLAGTPL